MSRPKPSSRANGRLSRGPKTPEGKERSRLNALRHGIFAKDSTIFDESTEEFDHFLTQHINRFRPRTTEEARLVAAIASARFRAFELQALETGILSEYAAQQPSGDSIGRITAAFSQFANAGRAYLTLHRREARYHRLHDRAFDALFALRQNKTRKNDESNLNLGNLNAQVPSADNFTQK